MWAKSRRSAMSASTTRHDCQPLEYQLNSTSIRVLFMDSTSSLPNPGPVAEHGTSGGVRSPGLWGASLLTLQPLNRSSVWIPFPADQAIWPPRPTLKVAAQGRLGPCDSNGQTGPCRPASRTDVALEKGPPAVLDMVLYYWENSISRWFHTY